MSVTLLQRGKDQVKHFEVLTPKLLKSKGSRDTKIIWCSVRYNTTIW